MCNLTEQVSHLDSVDRQKGKRKLLTTEKTVHTHVCPVPDNTSFAHTLGYPEWNNTLYTFCQCILYTLHGIMTVLLNNAILDETELI